MADLIVAAAIGYIDRAASPGSATLFVATKDFVTTAADNPANTHFAGRLQGGVSYSFEVRPPYTGFRPSSGFGTLVLTNNDGGLDNADQWTFRDQSVTVKILQPGETWGDGDVVATAIIDQVQISGLNRIEILLRDPAAILDRPLIQQTFTDEVWTPEAIGKLRPFAFGTPLSVSPVLVRESDNRYHVSEADIIAVDDVRVNGASVTFTAIDKGFTLDSAPSGQVTADVVASGAANFIGFTISSPEPSGILFSNNNKTVQNTNRNFFSPEPPDQWTGIAGTAKSAAAGGKYYFETLVGRGVNSSANYNGTYGYFLEVATGICLSTINADGFIDQADQYSVGLHSGDNVVTFQDEGSAIDDTDTTLTGNDGDDALFSVLVDFDNLTVQFRLHQRSDATRPVIWSSSVLSITDNSPLPLFYPFGTVVGATGATDSRSQDNKITIRTQPEDLETAIPSGYEAWDTSAYSESTQFTDLVTAITAQIPGLTVDTTSRDAISALGYSYSFYVKDGKSAARVLYEACASFIGWSYIDRTGKLAFGRLQTPGATGVADFTEAKIIGIQRYGVDYARGLSDRMGALKNWTIARLDSTDDTLDESTRVLLSEQYRHEATAESTLAETYNHAKTADLLPSYFRAAADANLAIEDLVSLFSVEHYIVEAEVAFVLEDYLALSLGATVTITFDRYNFGTAENVGGFTTEFDSGFEVGGAGQGYIVLGYSGDFEQGVIRLKLWGTGSG